MSAVEDMRIEHEQGWHAPRIDGQLCPYGSKAAMGCPLCIAEEQR